MVLQEIIAIIIAALTAGIIGWLVGTLTTVTKFSDRLVKVETKLDILTRDMAELKELVRSMKPDVPPCSFLIDLKEQHIELKGRVDALVK